MSIQKSAHRATLTHEHNRLRSLHHQRSWRRPTELRVRGHHLVAENPDSQHLTDYELRGEDGEVLGTIELDDFHNADDLVRFVNAAIQHDFESARQWARDEFLGWSQ